MPTELARLVAERRALRFALACGLSLATAYALAVPLPFLAPLLVAFLGAAPGPPMKPRALATLVLVVVVALSVGVLLIPLLRYYPVSAVLLAGAGLYLSMYLTLIAGKRLLGTLLAVGITFVSIAGRIDNGLAFLMIVALSVAVVIAVVSQWVVYPLFPEPLALAPAEAAETPEQSSWFALRSALIVMPAYLLALVNPGQYLMTIMKSVALSQQATLLDARRAGHELLGSTFAGGLLAVLFWTLLSIAPTLWMYALWMTAVALFVGCKLYGVLGSDQTPSFWVNAIVTMLILLGPAVQDSANGDAAAAAFAIRFLTFVGVTLYAWIAIAALEAWRARRRRSSGTVQVSV